ncbi:hypothetical protein BX616_001586 [Lobosporangium transversale]|nr:hypothetical protein BX616_001586 [Lobosporangium transversale]
MSMHRLVTRLSGLGLYPTSATATASLRTCVTTASVSRYSTVVPGKVDLSNLSDNPGSKSQRLRVGRGQGSGKGNTAARGHKGQKARAGNNGQPKPGFEGGQTRLIDRLPKRPFFLPFCQFPIIDISN